MKNVLIKLAHLLSVIGSVYCNPKSGVKNFLDALGNSLSQISNLKHYIFRDVNIDISQKPKQMSYVSEYLNFTRL